MNRFILFFATLYVASASARTIQGIVMECDSTPIEFASITAFANDSVVGGCVTDANCLFRLYIGKKCNRIRVSYIGYKEVSISPVGSDVGKIVLDARSTSLKELVVKAPLISKEADRIIMNVTANPLSANKDAHELLKTAPGVWADDNTLSIYGQRGTIVYVDDKKVNLSGSQLTTYLKSMQSSSISTIEIIQRAGAEYSADSGGGIIRINLKRNRVDGLSGCTGSNFTNGEYKNWINPFANVSLHTGNWTVGFNGSLNGTPAERYAAYNKAENRINNQHLSGVSRHRVKTIQGNGSTSMSYEPTDKNRFGLQLDYNTEQSRNISHSRTDIYGTEHNASTFGKYTSNDIFRNINLTFNWVHTIDNGGSVVKLLSNYNYQSIGTNENNRMYILTDSIYKSDNTNRYRIFVTELSLRKVFSKKWNMTIGARYKNNDVTYKSFHSFMDGVSWVGNPDYDNDISYKEDIAALYITVYCQTERWKFKAGLRGEYFSTSGNETNGNRMDYFPNANITYGMTEKGDYTVSAGYYRNIRRPTFRSLNPTEMQVSDYSYDIGNPNLKPSFSNAVTLDFLLAGKYTIAAGYSVTNYPIRQMFISEYPERMYLTWENIGKDRNYYIHGNGLLSITKWWNLYAGLTYIITSQKTTDVTKFETFGYIQFVANTSIFLPKQFSFTLNCFYNSKMKIGNITIYPIFNLNPSIQKRFGNKWIITLGVENILQHKSQTSTSSSDYHRINYTNQYAAAKIGFTYNFSYGKKIRPIKIEKDTDTSRLGKDN